MNPLCRHNPQSRRGGQSDRNECTTLGCQGVGIGVSCFEDSARPSSIVGLLFSRRPNNNFSSIDGFKKFFLQKIDRCFSGLALDILNYRLSLLKVKKTKVSDVLADLGVIHDDWKLRL
jgi:hypothetical protein